MSFVRRSAQICRVSHDSRRSRPPVFALKSILKLIQCSSPSSVLCSVENIFLLSNFFRPCPMKSNKLRILWLVWRKMFARQRQVHESVRERVSGLSVRPHCFCSEDLISFSYRVHLCRSGMNCIWHNTNIWTRIGHSQLIGFSVCYDALTRTMK